MALLPDPNNLQPVEARPSMSVASEDTTAPGTALAQTGGIASQVGLGISHIVAAEHYKISSTEAQNALNQLQQRQLALSVQAGSTHGANVVNTPDGGKPFISDYTDQFNAARDEIAGKLSPQAKAMFDPHAAGAALSFQSGLLQHSASELATYNVASTKDTIATNSAGAQMNWDNQDAINVLLSNTANSADRTAGYLGLPDKQEAVRQALVPIHTAVIDGALAAGNPEYASKYLQDNKDQIGKDLLPLKEKIDHFRAQYAAASTAATTRAVFANKINPTQIDNAFAVALNTESGGQQFNRDGSVVMSPAGAIGIAQIMPATAPEAAKLAGLPYDSNRLLSDPAYNQALGKAYFAKQVQDFGGDLNKAWAAYNAGPAAVNKALAQTDALDKQQADVPGAQPNNWLALMPKETQDYVAKNSKNYAAGAGEVPPTLMEYKNKALAILQAQYPDATPAMIAANQTKAESDFRDDLANKNELRDRTLLDIKQQFDAGNIHSFADLTPQQLQLLGQERGAASAYMDTRTTETDHQLSNTPVSADVAGKLELNPDLLTAMSVADLYRLAPQIGSARVTQLVNKRQAYLADPDAKTAAKVDSTMFNSITSGLGLLGKSSTEKQVKLDLLDRVEDAIRVRRKAGIFVGDEEKRALITNMALEIPKVKNPDGSFTNAWGLLPWDSTDKKRAFQVDDVSNVVIPDADKELIQKVAAAKGRDVSTPEAMYNAYTDLLKVRAGAKKK